MGEPQSALNTKFNIGDGATPENFTSVAELISIDGIGQSRNEIDTSILESIYERFQVGIVRNDPIVLDVNFDPDEPTHDPSTGIIADFVSGDDRNCQFEFPDGSMFTFTVKVTAWKIDGFAVDDVIKGHFTVKPLGIVSFTSASGS